jgi:hypothetical protein
MHVGALPNGRANAPEIGNTLLPNCSAKSALVPSRFSVLVFPL